MRMHPDGVASLLASILLDGDRQMVRLKVSDEQILDARRDQVLRLAREYYKVYPCDYDNSRDLEERERNSRNNLAKLNRANLR